MIQSLLIANRGEIACRIIRTCELMDIRTVAVYSDADARALHVREADEAVHIGPNPARESYLVGDKIIAAARQTGAEAIHPGYGFLSENAAFAQAVIDAGLIWVGPRPASITAMGLKDAAKARMIAAGVPVTPGYLGADQSPERLQAEADAIGYPVLIKAVAGGGGKGMRRVDDRAAFGDALDSCRREAAASFGDDRVLIEKYILSPRHIEVQVFGDTHGNIVHLFERDCTLQRRHQKVIEEAPAPGMDEATRADLCAAAVRAAQAVDYVGAGTIEFIADASAGLRADRIWFMEMNTRLQVEHPVTEAITGIDLVEWQLRVASGEALPRRQDELSINGWAMEARLYAEDPGKGFLPSIGPLRRLALPKGERVDTGVEEGGEVTPYYDPMIAKIISHGDDRGEALNRLRRACARTRVWPVRTNAGFLARLLGAKEVRAGVFDTGFIAGHEALASPRPFNARAAGAALTVLVNDFDRCTRRSNLGIQLAGFRLNAPRRDALNLYVDGQAVLAPWSPSYRDVEMLDDAQPDWIDGETVMFAQGEGHAISLDARPVAGAGGGSGAVLAPMPGRLTSVDVAVGDAVTRGKKMMVLEAMKMEHTLTAPFDGTVVELPAVAGQQVQVDALLVRIEA